MLFEKINVEKLLRPLNEVEKKYAPRYLYTAGDINIAKLSPKVSIIGSRHPSEEGLNNAKALVEYLLKLDAVIVSGLALGIDTIAHKTAIDNGGKTIAVLGTPLDEFYPKENCLLQKEIMKNYLAISQFSPGYPIRRENFPIRNRVMALISDASIIVEAGETSGSLSQGWEALRLGRQLFILENILENKKLKWPYKMVSYGARIISMRNGTKKRLFEALPPSGSEGVNVSAAINS